MFYSISIISKEDIDNKLQVTLSIKDTCFQETIVLTGPHVQESCYEPVAIHKVYTARNLNVARNLAVYYITMMHGDKYIVTDISFFEKYFPTISYNKLNARLVKSYYNDFITLIKSKESPIS